MDEIIKSCVDLDFLKSYIEVLEDEMSKNIDTETYMELLRDWDKANDRYYELMNS